MSNRLSVATIDSPEFINIEGISPFAARCEIKVLYLGANRNGSFINKEVAAQMAQTLPGCPIVGYYSDNKEDFRDHGDQMIIDADGVKFKCLTTPYGFVAPDAKVWFKDFEDTDEFGNTIVRTYLMTEGYLWTEQYKEAQKILNEGRPQSMELDEKTLKGHWSTDVNRGLDFFIINDAIFSKLCILGEDVEPCFEGAAVTAPDVSASFTVNDKFTSTLYSMMQDLKKLTYSLQEQGGNSMGKDQYVVLESGEPVVQATEPVVEEQPVVEPVVIEQPVVTIKEKKEEEATTVEQPIVEEEGEPDLDNIEIEIEKDTEDFAKKEEKEEEDKEEDSEDSDEKNSDSEDNSDEEKKAKTKNSLEEKYALLETQLSELQAKCDLLESQNAELTSFKAEVEDKEKTALIESFYMLSDEDKKDVIENKSKYSLDEIESKLSVICVRKKVNFNLEESTEKETVPTTFNIDSNAGEELPAWLKAVEARKSIEE